MSGIAVPDHASSASAAGPPLVSRQAVVDGPMRVRGYRVAYAPAGNVSPADGADELAVFERVFTVDGLEELVGDAIAHITLSGQLLRYARVPPLRPRAVVLRVAYEDMAQDDVFGIVQELASRGYVLELDGLSTPDVERRMLAPFGIVEIDVSQWSSADIEALMPTLTAAEATALASGVQDHDARQHARSMGCTLFTGPFLCTPRVIEERAIPRTVLTTLVDVSRLQGDDTPLEELIRVIERDSRLSSELLRFVNSAQFGVTGKVSRSGMRRCCSAPARCHVGRSRMRFRGQPGG